MKIKILDYGSVELLCFFDNIIHAARQSRQSHDRATPERDAGLIRQMLSGNEMSAFEHAVFAFSIRAPIMVRDHLFTYRMASKLAESFRFNRLDEVEGENIFDKFYFPDNERMGEEGALALRRTAVYCISQYRAALHRGDPPELARLHLNTPGIYTAWDWTLNASSLMNVFEQRLTRKTQIETRRYAQALWCIFEDKLPNVAAAFREINPGLEYGDDE